MKNIRALFCLALSAVFLTGSCSGGGKAGGPRKFPPAPVRVVKAEKKDVPYDIEGIGVAESIAPVAVVAQVNGQIEKIHFMEGAFVHKGDLIVTIDPRPFKAALSLASANLSRDEAQLKNAKKEEARNRELIKKGFVSQSQYDQIAATADALTGTVSADKAGVDVAKLNLEYCFIRSPITGKAGEVTVKEGNQIKANDKTIVTILQIRPIYATFSVPQTHLPLIRKYQEKGALSSTAIPTSGKPETGGKIVFTDNAVDQATGTIKLKAVFENADHALWPGQFLRVSLFLTVEKGVVVVPSQALMATQKGQTVYVVKGDGTAELRPVKVEREHGMESVIEGGLQAGETVVLDGQLQTMPGGMVKVIENNPPAEKK
ncbi:MAG: efflux RND transporter periplasmic adaptor subunit [Nitrospinae bacterium]|nr:efflux RND transporter periplasmic adaptor subunit [Nitrospinota bacterium]